jgi:hypothetical protein
MSIWQKLFSKSKEPPQDEKYEPVKKVSSSPSIDYQKAEIMRHAKNLGGGPSYNPDLVRKSADELVRIGEMAVPVLAEVLRTGNEFEAEGAVIALIKIGPAAKEAVPALVSGLQHKDPNVRGGCAVALGKVDPGSPQSIQRMVSAFSVNSGAVHQMLIQTLIEVGDKCIPALVSATKDLDIIVRKVSASALSKITGSEQDDWQAWWKENKQKHQKAEQSWAQYLAHEESIVSDDAQTDALLIRDYYLRVKSASEYRVGEKVIFAYYGKFGPNLIHPGTKAEVVGVETDPLGKGSLSLNLPVLGVRHLSAKYIDSLERGQGNEFCSLGHWIPCRRTDEKREWVVDSSDYVKVRLDDGSLLEGRWYTITADKARISNMIARRR